MDNLNQSLGNREQVTENKASWPLIFFIILVVIAIGVAWQFTGDKFEPAVVDEPVFIVEETPEAPEVREVPEVPEIAEELPKPIIETPEIVTEVNIIEPVIIEPVKEPIPLLDNSDDWLKLKLPEITWRKELLKLIIDEDMIRRFVVFTDNFAQGIIAYEHSPFIMPNTKFVPEEDNDIIQKNIQKAVQTSSGSPLAVKKNIWQWNEHSGQRFSLYVDLIKSMDSESLVQWYSEIKPLINEAYNELGYEDDFTHTLQDAITRVLDMELPKTSMTLIQPSVMYKFADPELEALPDADKLLLRLGKENLLVMKSVLLELYEKLAQQKNGVH